MLIPNQYGRTSFLFAGVPGMQMPVSLYKDPTRCPELCPGGVNLSVYEQVHDASLFSLYLPIANEADIKWAETGRNYTNLEFYHTLLMTNHMEQDKDTFAEGIRGRTLWHNEYRSQVMYATRGTAKTDRALWPGRLLHPPHRLTERNVHPRRAEAGAGGTVTAVTAREQQMTRMLDTPYFEARRGAAVRWTSTEDARRGRSCHRPGHQLRPRSSPRRYLHAGLAEPSLIRSRAAASQEACLM